MNDEMNSTLKNKVLVQSLQENRHFTVAVAKYAFRGSFKQSRNATYFQMVLATVITVTKCSFRGSYEPPQNITSCVMLHFAAVKNDR